MAVEIDVLITYAESLMAVRFPHIIYLVNNASSSKDIQIITSIDSDIPIPKCDELVPLAAKELNHLVGGLGSDFGMLMNNRGAVCMGWGNPTSNRITAAILTWILNQDHMPIVRVKRLLDWSGYRRVLEEHVSLPGMKIDMDHFQIIPDVDEVKGIVYQRDDNYDSLQWEFEGDDGNRLQEFLRETFNLGRSPIFQFSGAPNLTIISRN